MNDYDIDNKTKYFLDKCWELIFEKNKIIILVIQLIIALLVIASFNEKIIPISSVSHIKFLIIFLLALTPIMLIDYTLKLSDGINSLEKALNTPNVSNKPLYKKILDGSNYLYTVIIIIVIDIIIGVIAQSLMKTIIILLIQFLVIVAIIVSMKKFDKLK